MSNNNNNENKNLTLAAFLSDGLMGTLIFDRQLTPGAVASLLGVLRKHVVPALGSHTLMELERELPRYIEALKAEGLAPRTVHQVVTVLKRVADVAYEQGLISERLFVSTAQARVETVERVTAGEAERIVRAAEDDLEQLMFTLMVDTGLRAGEILALRWDDFHPSQEMITVTNRKRPIQFLGFPGGSYQGAPRDGRSIPLSKRLLALLKTVRSSADTFLFAVNDIGAIHRRVVRAVVRSGVGSSREPTKLAIGPHDLRRLFGIRLGTRGVPVALICKWMGLSARAAKGFGLVRGDEPGHEQRRHTPDEERAILVAALEDSACDEDES